MNNIEEIRNKLEDIRDSKKEERETVGNALAECLIRIVEEDRITEDDLDEIRMAMDFLCTVRRHVIGDELAEELYEKIAKVMVDYTKDKKPIAKRILCARVLVSNYKGQIISEIANDLWISHITRVYYPAMEAEADCLPSEGLMDWYAEFLSKNLSYKTVARMFNRLAYYWLNAYRSTEHISRAKAYFLAMERRGILPENPYGGGYGDGNCPELITKLLNDEYEKGLEDHLHNCITFLIRDFSEGNSSKSNIHSLRRNMQKMYSLFTQDDVTINMERWDKTLCEYCEVLENCCEDKDSANMAKSAEAMISCLTDSDNWLLRYLQIENMDNSDEEILEKIQEWIERIDGLSLEETWPMMNSLQGIIANRYFKLGVRDKLVEVLDKMTSTTDSIAYMGDDYVDGMGIRYCTPNTIALLRLLIDDGKHEEADIIIKEIASVPEDVEEFWSFDNYSRLWKCWTKYICFLDEFGFDKESKKWKEKLKQKFLMTDDDVQWEIAYLKGDYDESLIYCEKSLKASHDEDDDDDFSWDGWYGDGVRFKNKIEKSRMINVLKYIIDGTFPEGVDPKKIEVLADKPKDSILCRGTRYTFYESCRMFQMTNEEWHKFSASSATMAELFEKGIHNPERAEIYPSDYYKVALAYEPEPAILRGDYIRYLYDTHERDWFGFKKSDYEKIKEAVATSPL